ncbi:hypothetical protein IWW55_003722, partial [Coemansia sp. RSA 2706]
RAAADEEQKHEGSIQPPTGDPQPVESNGTQRPCNAHIAEPSVHGQPPGYSSPLPPDPVHAGAAFK